MWMFCTWQGILVSVIFCFFNGEVRSALVKYWKQCSSKTFRYRSSRASSVCVTQSEVSEFVNNKWFFLASPKAFFCITFRINIKLLYRIKFRAEQYCYKANIHTRAFAFSAKVTLKLCHGNYEIYYVIFDPYKAPTYKCYVVNGLSLEILLSCVKSFINSLLSGEVIVIGNID